MEEYNPDVLRLWALVADYTSPVVMSDMVLKEAAEEYRKYRTTFRFLLQNLSDLQPSDMVPVEDLRPLDCLVLLQLRDVLDTVHDAFKCLDFARACRALLGFVKEGLSKRYFEGSKPVLYFSLPR